jgi:hypothetical protein
MANASISLVNLNFDEIKNNFKAYLRSNSSFRDVDFEGSNIAVLLDLLSYNTYLNAYYTNMVASEMFLDTAQLRDSIVSHAKELNYLPRSFTSARAEVNIIVTPLLNNNASTLLVPKGTTFTSRIGSNTFTFSTDQNVVVNAKNNNGQFIAESVLLYEGVYIADQFSVNLANTQQRFVLSNPTVDTSSILVTVIEDNGANAIVHTVASTLYQANSTSSIFFLQPAENNQYEVVFGDGNFGRKPKDGAVVVVEYRTTHGELPNGARTFVSDGAIDGHANVSVETVEVARGGSIAETTESIRLNAPRYLQVQERAITTNDYKLLLTREFPEIQSINVYGGEEVDPPQFGRVFISVDVEGADGVPESNKDQYFGFIVDKVPLTITPVIVDPDFLYIDVNTTVTYNVNTTKRSAEDIRTAVIAALTNYSLDELEDFDVTLRYSRLIGMIDEVDPSIISNDTEVRPIKIFTPSTSTSSNYTIEFKMPLEQTVRLDMDGTTSHEAGTENNVYSSRFVYNGKVCFFDDDGRGNLFIFTYENDTHRTLRQVGTVNYETGEVKLLDFQPQSYDGSGVKIYARARNKDISVKLNSILKVLEEDIDVTVVSVRE